MTDTAGHPMPSGQRMLITFGLLSATLMQVLDQTIANVALPHMQASLGATQESIAWVLTSYIIAAAVCMPMTGWLSARYGARRLFMVATIGFTIASMACGLATTLAEIIIYRLLQGALGAFLVPLSQAAMYDIYPREKHAQAMSIWGMGVMVGPVLGPVLGGWLTDVFNWRYVFFINLPFGIMALLLTSLMPKGERIIRRFDMRGFILIGLALGALQLMLDRGTQLDWFNSWEIWIELGVTLAALWAFGVHIMTADEAIFQKELFGNLNLMVAMLFTFVVGGVLVAGSALLAPMLQHLMGYAATDAGFASMPRGVGTMIGMIVGARLFSRIDARWLIFAGLVLTAWSLHMMSGFTLEMDRSPILISGLIQGIGLGFTVMPLSVIAFSTLSSRLRTDATALYSLMRSMGGAIAISITNALLARNLQVSHSDLGQHITLNLQTWFAKIQLRPASDAFLSAIDLEINRQSLMIAYLDNFYLMFWATIVIIPMVLLLRKQSHSPAPGEAVIMAD